MPPRSAPLFTKGTLVTEVTPSPEPSPDRRPRRTRRSSLSPSASATGQPAASQSPSAGPTATASSTRVEQGGSFTVSVTGLAAGEQISAVLNSQPLTITGIPAADARGAVTFRVTVPADFANGAHTLVITRADGSTLSRLGVQVVAAGTLARTGAELPWGLGLAPSR